MTGRLVIIRADDGIGIYEAFHHNTSRDIEAFAGLKFSHDEPVAASILSIWTHLDAGGGDARSIFPGPIVDENLGNEIVRQFREIPAARADDGGCDAAFDDWYGRLVSAIEGELDEVFEREALHGWPILSLESDNASVTEAREGVCPEALPGGGLV